MDSLSSVASTVTPLLASQIERAIRALAPAHLLTPVARESFINHEDALKRLQDWAFTQGFAVVTESVRKGRVIFQCIHHRKKTRNTRKTLTEDRERVSTAIRAKGCTWTVYVSQREKTKEAWILGWAHQEHCHNPNPDPFTYDQHKTKKPGYLEAVTKATVHNGVAPFSTSSKMLQKEGLPVLTKKEYYNLSRKPAGEGGRLTKQKEIQVLLQYLEDHQFHTQVRYEHAVDENGVRTGTRIVQDVFFISDAQISLGRRFVSDFLYETDATFNTNELRLPLSTMVGITNTGKTFPMAYCYITSESAKSFDFVGGELTKYIFYDCPEAAVICADFTKGLGAAIAAKALRESGVEDEAAQERRLEAGELPDVTAMFIGNSDAKTLLQLCEWHAVKAIQRRLVHAGKYSKERREELTDLVNAWIKAPSVNDVFKAREALLKELQPPEQQYLIDYYQPKEEQFLRCWTMTYSNLGVHSTQRNEGYHVITKRPLIKHLQLHKAVEYLVEDLENLLSVHYAIVNRERNFRPILLDLDAFSKVGDLLTHYALDLVMTEWSNTKIMGLAIEEGKEEAVDFEPENPGSGCLLACELPLRYGLPCKHWMYAAFLRGCQLPLSLFHPRWLFDGPPVLHERWKMSWSDSVQAPSPTRVPEPSQSRFHGRGEEMVKGAALEAVLLLRKCPPSIAENYAVAVRDMNAILLEKQQELLARAEAAPLELPAPLPQPNAREFPTSRKRKMTGYEAALQEERDVVVRRRRAVIQAQGEHDDGRRYADRRRASALIRQSQRELSSSLPPSHQPPIRISSASLSPSPPPALALALALSPFPSPSPAPSLAPSPAPEPERTPSPEVSPSENGDKEGRGSGSEGRDFEVEVPDRRPRRNKPRESLKAAENTLQRKDGLVDASRRSMATAKAPAKRRKPGKKALQAAREMSQLLDAYYPPPSNTVILNS
jgi:hypothetical protein